MDIYRLKEDISFAEQIGATLDVGQRLRLQLGLIRLTELANADQLLFWGRVETLSKAYYIAMSLDYKGHYQFPLKRFFWSQSDMVFAQMPALLPEYGATINGMNLTPFTGNPGLVIVNVTGSEQNKEETKKEQIEQQVDSDQDNTKQTQPKNLTQLDRLAVVVRAIENDCHAIPIGAVRMNQEHQLRQNIGFAGLSVQEAGQLSNYQLLRAPQSPQKREAISKPDSIFKKDFLDTIDGAKTWSVQADCSKRDVTVRNLLWPGYLSYHRAETSILGGVYMGDGVKRVDLAFFL